MSRINERDEKHGDTIDKAAAFLIGFACVVGLAGHLAGLW